MKISGYFGNNNNTMAEDSSEEDSSSSEQEEDDQVQRISAHKPLMDLENEGSTSDVVQKFIKQILQESSISNRNIEERAKYIPMRLSMEERKQLRLIEAALTVSEYTDKVDILKFGSKSKRILEQLKDICAILSGLLVASDYDLGKEVVENRNFKDNAKFFQNIFEVGRRHKIMNPEKMRTEYGKLIYLLQDASQSEIQTMLEFECKRNVRTVYGHLGEVLRDSRITVATREIVDDGKKSRSEIQREIKEKERAVEELARKFQNSQITDEEIRVCLRSIGDNNSFLKDNCYPVEQMIYYLTSMFHPEKVEKGYSLAISAGYEGARLSHDHTRQFLYVLQSLVLWREISLDMFKLWHLAEEDLLDSQNPYHLTNTGQGLNRVQPAPRVSKAMHQILATTQRKVGQWVGSSVIHLGDHNVPNALMFIDKYTQVPRIINPIIITIQNIDKIAKDKGIRSYIDSIFGGPEKLKKDILLDFFRHAFDGSGADNFFDAGSCIDGRLTSAWNWCSLIEKKPYYPVFKLAGFNGFDGDFQK
eukprot:CAMPEP_0168571086 /NCGR_PEP_ID=MMETSP0413-20121227/17124_1 /TAXON_ID=136452 /ORGANISM="Filamoeba nolandi, Strain NC-AS-23-1" /LENGTH=532 /DNA_ID=CAMNT_0008603867 /DNA_START=66 /DNA_END=1664 /DNA_ORIENTATION=+